MSKRVFIERNIILISCEISAVKRQYSYSTDTNGKLSSMGR